MSPLASLRHDPPAIADWCWQGLEFASQNPAHPWRLGVLATTSLSGHANARTLVLRQVSASTRQIFAYSDARAEKLSELQRQPRIAWVCYDAIERVQLRLCGEATLHTRDAVADDHWARLPVVHRRQYLAPVAPGTEYSEPFINRTERAASDDLTWAESNAGRLHFAVICITVASIDWYYLHSEGHLRLRLDWSTDDWQATWLAS